MKDDDFDGNSTPPPPHERAWRHPAEFAAQQRIDIAHAHPAPRLSRRASIVTAVSSVIVSMAVLAVVIPGGPHASTPSVDGSVTTAPRSPLTTIPKGSSAEGAIPDSAATLLGSLEGNQGESSVIALGGAWFLAGSDDVTNSADTLPVRASTSGSLDTVVQHRHESAGIALLRAVGDANASSPSLDGITGLRVVPSSRFNEPGYLAGLSIVDHKGAQSFTVLDSRISDHAVGDLPVATDRPIRGVAALVDTDGKVVGAAVHCSNVTWIVSSGRILSLMEQWPNMRETDTSTRP